MDVKNALPFIGGNANHLLCASLIKWPVASAIVVANVKRQEPAVKKKVWQEYTFDILEAENDTMPITAPQNFSLLQSILFVNYYFWINSNTQCDMAKVEQKLKKKMSISADHSKRIYGFKCL